MAAPTVETETKTTLELDRMQGLIARGYGNLPAAQFIIVRFGDAPAGRAWLREIAAVVTPGSARPERRSVNVAFTYGGLAHLGLSADALDTFSPEFQEGMTTPHRSRILGDHDEGDPANWRWGVGAAAVHAVLLLYALDDDELAHLRRDEGMRLARHAINVIVDLDTFACHEFREHFGFRDGIAQPIIRGLGRTGPEENTVDPGEFVLGYRNQYERLPGSPTVSQATDVNSRLERVHAEDDFGTASPERHDFGRNGTYLVFRQLSQDVEAFWKFVEGMSRDAAGQTQLHDCVALASKMVGRWPNGAPLAVAPEHADPKHANTDDFGYHEHDHFGDRCPVGAHIRRANPRDSLAPDAAASTKVSGRHRLLRRGRTYGKPVAPSMDARDILAADNFEGERGIHFICLNTDIARQFEFVQHTWINNLKFEGMYHDVDAIAGDHDRKNAGYFTIPAEPVRRRVHGVPRFVHVRGGAYFFLPSINALRYIGDLE
jgi:Dyp-type peroxidase family